MKVSISEWMNCYNVTISRLNWEYKKNRVSLNRIKIKTKI